MEPIAELTNEVEFHLESEQRHALQKISNSVLMKTRRRSSTKRNSRHHRVGVALPEADRVRQEVFLERQEECLRCITMTDKRKGAENEKTCRWRRAAAR